MRWLLLAWALLTPQAAGAQPGWCGGALQPGPVTAGSTPIPPFQATFHHGVTLRNQGARPLAVQVQATGPMMGRWNGVVPPNGQASFQLTGTAYMVQSGWSRVPHPHGQDTVLANLRVACQ